MNHIFIILGSFVLSVFLIFIARSLFGLKLNDKGVVVIGLVITPVLAILYIFLSIFWH